MSIETPHTPCLLVVVDMNPFFWGARSYAETDAQPTAAAEVAEGGEPSLPSEAAPAREPFSGAQLHLSEFLAVLLTFLNAYRLTNRDSQVRVIGCHLTGAVLLLDTTKLKGFLAKELTESVRQLARTTSVAPQASAADADADGIDYGSKLGAALSLGICIGSKLIREKCTPRIIVFSVSPDLSEQYIAVMNCIFSAQKLKILIDACVLFEQDSSLLQQAAYITGGVYLRPRAQKQALIQYLLSAFLPDAETRQYIKVPLLKSVDFRASCFCHKRSENIAYVCSVCLSIFCTFLPVCPTCSVRFPFQTDRE